MFTYWVFLSAPPPNKKQKKQKQKNQGAELDKIQPAESNLPERIS